jgi:hypothetical protein
MQTGPRDTLNTQQQALLRNLRPLLRRVQYITYRRTFCITEADAIAIIAALEERARWQGTQPALAEAVLWMICAANEKDEYERRLQEGSLLTPGKPRASEFPVRSGSFAVRVFSALATEARTWAVAAALSAGRYLQAWSTLETALAVDPMMFHDLAFVRRLVVLGVRTGSYRCVLTLMHMLSHFQNLPRASPGRQAPLLQRAFHGHIGVFRQVFDLIRGCWRDPSSRSTGAALTNERHPEPASSIMICVGKLVQGLCLTSADVRVGLDMTNPWDAFNGADTQDPEAFESGLIMKARAVLQKSLPFTATSSMDTRARQYPEWFENDVRGFLHAALAAEIRAWMLTSTISAAVFDVLLNTVVPGIGGQHGWVAGAMDNCLFPQAAVFRDAHPHPDIVLGKHGHKHFRPAVPLAYEALTCLSPKGTFAQAGPPMTRDVSDEVLQAKLLVFLRHMRQHAPAYALLKAFKTASKTPGREKTLYDLLPRAALSADMLTSRVFIRLVRPLWRGSDLRDRARALAMFRTAMTCGNVAMVQGLMEAGFPVEEVPEVAMLLFIAKTQDRAISLGHSARLQTQGLPTPKGHWDMEDPLFVPLNVYRMVAVQPCVTPYLMILVNMGLLQHRRQFHALMEAIIQYSIHAGPLGLPPGWCWFKALPEERSPPVNAAGTMNDRALAMFLLCSMHEEFFHKAYKYSFSVYLYKSYGRYMPWQFLATFLIALNVPVFANHGRIVSKIVAARGLNHLKVLLHELQHTETWSMQQRLGLQLARSLAGRSSQTKVPHLNEAVAYITRFLEEEKHIDLEPLVRRAGMMASYHHVKVFEKTIAAIPDGWLNDPNWDARSRWQPGAVLSSASSSNDEDNSGSPGSQASFSPCPFDE